MARFYKFTGYLLDVNDDFNSFEDYMVYINNRKYGGDIDAFDVQCAELEWDDDIDLNRYDCTREQMDKYFET